MNQDNQAGNEAVDSFDKNHREPGNPGTQAGASGRSRPQPQRESPSFARFCGHYGPTTGAVSLSGTFDAMIKRPGEISFGILEARTPGLKMFLLVIFILCAASYGLIMASFKGGHQYWSVPVRLTLGWLLSAAICLPSLHIFSSLAGGRQSFVESAGLLLQSMALNAIIMIGFAPVAWIFSQSTDGDFFMGFIHLSAWVIGALFARSLIVNCFLLHNGQKGFITLWNIIYLLVALQMSTTLRPLVGEYDSLAFTDKMFFLEHWFR